MTQPSMNILVVDDDPTTRELMRAALEKAGFVVALADNGLDALRQFQAQPCDLVMLDVDMPGLDGYQVCARLRQAAGDELPIVMVTGMDNLESIERAFDTGATDFMAKPINWALIGHRVRYLLRAYLVQQNLHTAIAHNAAILKAVPDTLLRLDAKGWVLDLRLGRRARDIQYLARPGYPLVDYFPVEISGLILAAAARVRTSGIAEDLDFMLTINGGEARYYEARLGRINAQETLCLLHDISQRKQQEIEILATQNKLQATLEAIPDLMFELDLEGRYLDYRSPRTDLLFVPPAQLLGRTVRQVLPAGAAAVCLAALREADAAGISTGKQFQLPLSQGVRWFELSVSRKHNGTALNATFIVLSRDITERKEAENRVYRMAYFDALTGLPNRASFFERLNREIQRASQLHKLAILFLDLDGFKNVNDTLGHAAGDLLLQGVADRLRLGVRPADLVARHDVSLVEADLARLGGDEFTVLVPQLPQGDTALTVASRIHELMRQPFALDGREVVLTTSIGIAIYPDDGEDAATLVKHADTAMYHAKDRGRDNCQFYSAALTEVAMRRLDLESNLRQALARGEFSLVYQPQLDLASGRIESVEALLRWNHPVQGVVSPLDFIPLAEETGLIVPIGDWVLRTACADAVRWRDAGHPLRVAVNLSAVQFRSPQLVNRIRSILQETRMAAELLELEVTEGVLMEDSEATLKLFAALRAVGMRLALDDFGTGFSSLNYLKRMPLNTLKVDQQFVRGLPQDQENLAIVRAIISLAKNLGFTITAEGVETPDQALLLSGLACDALQGYFISKPVPAAAIPALLAQRWRLSRSRRVEPEPLCEPS